MRWPFALDESWVTTKAASQLSRRARRFHCDEVSHRERVSKSREPPNSVMNYQDAHGGVVVDPINNAIGREATNLQTLERTPASLPVCSRRSPAGRPSAWHPEQASQLTNCPSTSSCGTTSQRPDWRSRSSSVARKHSRSIASDGRVFGQFADRVEHPLLVRLSGHVGNRRTVGAYVAVDHHPRRLPRNPLDRRCRRWHRRRHVKPDTPRKEVRMPRIA